MSFSKISENPEDILLLSDAMDIVNVVRAQDLSLSPSDRETRLFPITAKVLIFFATLLLSFGARRLLLSPVMARKRATSVASENSSHTAEELGSMYDYLAKVILLGPSGCGKYA